MLSALSLAALLSTPALAETPDAPTPTTLDASLHAPPPSLGDFATDASDKDKRLLLAAGLNFFLPGAGYLYNGEKPALLGAGMMVGAIGLTAVEQSHAWQSPGLRDNHPDLFLLMFGSVFVMNTSLAVDAYREAKSINEGTAARRLQLAPSVTADADGAPAYGLSAGIRY